MRKSVLIPIFTVCLLFGASNVIAEFIPRADFPIEQTKEKNWKFSLAPLYLWMVEMDGEIGIGPVDNAISVPFKDIFDNLEAIFTVHFEGLHHSNWGFLFDLSFLDISASEVVGLAVGPKEFKVDLTSVMAEAGGYYRFEEGPHAFDVLAGIRYTNLEPEVFVTPPEECLCDRAEDWVDPIIGLRYQYMFIEKWMLNLRGDIGGFGVGSDFTWHAIGFIQWQPWKYAGILAGYRALDQDYEDSSGLDRFKYDMLLHGPIFAINFMW